MKLVKLSLVAAMVMGASAFALDNVKVSGDAKLYYGTNNAGSADLFDRGDVFTNLTKGSGAYADTALRLGATGDLLKGVSFGVTGYAVSTLGLEKNLVSNSFSGAHNYRLAGNGTVTEANVNGAQVDDTAWIGELWMAATMGKTTVKAGRMEIDTPLVFTEKWNIVPNTFEAAVAINQDLPETTLVAAWIGKHNGTLLTDGVLGKQGGTTGFGDPVGVVATGAGFSTFGLEGAYAVGAVNNSFKPLTAQAWYYNVQDVADAYWLQGDIDCSLVKGVKIGAQYSEMSPKGTGVAVAGTQDDSSAYAFKLGYEGIENLKLSAAYSEVDNKGGLEIANVATEFGQSKLYTEAMWNFGYISAIGAESYNLKASYDIKDVAKVCVSYTDAENDHTVAKDDMKEIALSASRSFGPLDARLAYISTDADDQNNGKRFDTVNAYLTLNF
jgi:imipenem/basic amino acid-specific outer membrane pore